MLQNEDYGRLKLLEEALGELASLLGDQPTKPVSANLFCLEHGLTFEERSTIILTLNRMASELPLTDMATIRTVLVEKVPKLSDLSAPVFEGMVTVFVKNYVLVD